MIPSFQVGDVVKLRSGGIRMTVEEVIDIHQVKCIWVDDKGQPQRMNFVIATLELDD
jgi:uncharacterized protein YodC (DUF2158 family)